MLDFETICNQCVELCKLSEKTEVDLKEIEKLTILFIRSQDEIAIYQGKGTGKVYSAIDTWKYFPHTIYDEILEFGSAVIRIPGEPENTIKRRREKAGLSIEELSQKSNVSIEEIEYVESGKKSICMDSLWKLCDVLGIDKHRISTCDLS